MGGEKVGGLEVGGLEVGGGMNMDGSMGGEMGGEMGGCPMGLAVSPIGWDVRPRVNISRGFVLSMLNCV